MNALTNQLMQYALMLIPFAILAGLLKSALFKGWIGEQMVRLAARFLLDKDIYHSIHNVTLPTLDGTTQIDHIFVSQFGIFVVETKNYSGWIFGTADQAKWTQKIYKNSNQFQNPLRQNYKHIKALEAALNLTEDKFHSVIIFVGGSTFKTEMPANVTYAGEYIAYIKSFQTPVLTKQEVQSAFDAISTGRLKPSLATNREHVRHLQARADVTADRKCPKCGNALSVKTAKTGARAGRQFWGCSQFPKCRFTQEIG
jgi:restriction system protein